MKRLFSLILAFIVLSGTFAFGIDALGDTDGTITVSSAKEFMKFADKCSLDSWSVGKKVVLTKNIDLSKNDFKGVPTFSGEFDGKGHTISGVSISKDGSRRGLFRYVTSNATVKNVTVKGSIVPGGTASSLGAIAGENSGNIINCSFSGTVKGKNYVGAIAGINNFEGSVSQCDSLGLVYGEHYAGGICGQNFGTIISCTNKSQVNTNPTKVNMDIKEINWDNLTSAENTVEITDIGGIAGFSSGIIQSCTNKGTVGYEHIGYNVGGIAGRQSGYLNGCQNNGKVLGRKDIGGICGQLEPFTAIKFSQSTMNSLSTELSSLNKLIDATLNDVDYRQKDISAQLNQVKNYSDNAITDVSTLSHKTQELLNTNVDNINNTSARLTEALQSTADSLEGIDTLSEQTNSLIDEMKIICDELDSIDIDTDNLDKALDELGKASRKLKTASNQLSSGMKDLRLGISDVNKVLKAAQEVAKAFSALGDAYADTAEALKKAYDALAEISKSIKDGKYANIKDAVDAVSKAVSTASQAFAEASKQVEEIGSAMKKLGESVASADLGNFSGSASRISAACSNIASAFGNLDSAVSYSRKALAQLDSKKFDKAFDSLRKSLDLLSDMSGTLTEMSTGIADAMKKLSQEPIITIEPIDSEYMATADSLSDNIASITSVLDAVNSSLSANISSVKGNLQSINNQAYKVIDILIDSVNDAYNTNIRDEISNRFSDISEEDTLDQTTGKISACKNHSKINGDLNVGGICGQMAIEYDFDPEDDIANGQKRNADFLFTTRAIIRECQNDGDVYAKKNSVGCIVGKEDLGCIILCNACGSATSKTGNCVGGVAGESESIIKNTNAKCTLSGNNYIGGICGKGKHIYDSKSVVHIKNCNEYTGAIAGAISGECKRNYFLNDNENGIDSISYVGVAEPKSIEELIEMDNGDIFAKFTATFKYNGKIVKQIDFAYGDSIDVSQYPKLKSKNDKYPQWNNLNLKNLKRDIVVTATDKIYISAVESNIKRTNKLPAAVSEGRFSNKSVFTMKAIPLTKSSIFYKELERWDVNITDCYDDKTTIHYLPENLKPNQVIIFVKDNGKFKSIKTKASGKYVVFQMKPNKNEIIVLKKSWFNIASRILLGIIIFILLMMLLKGIAKPMKLQNA